MELNRSQIKVPFAETNVGSSLSQMLTLSSAGNFTLATGFPLSSSTDTTDFSVASATTNGCSANTTLGSRRELHARGYLSTAIQRPASGYGHLSGEQLDQPGECAADRNRRPGDREHNHACLRYEQWWTSAARPSPLTLTATIATATNAGAPTGTIVFMIDNTAEPPVAVTGTSASLTLTLPTGTHVVTATYSGDTNYASSVGTSSITVVQPATDCGDAGNQRSLCPGCHAVHPDGEYLLHVVVRRITGNVAISVDGGARPSGHHQFDSVSYR